MCMREMLLFLPYTVLEENLQLQYAFSVKSFNQLLHRNSSSPLPNSLPSSSIAESFCSSFSGKLLHFVSLSAITYLHNHNRFIPQTHLPLLMTLTLSTSSFTKYFPTNIRD